MMKNEVIVNQIVYNHTIYHNGEYRHYPTIIELKGLIQTIIKSNVTTNFIRFTPFYKNDKLDRQIEFDDYLFYIECRDQIDDHDLKEHIEECMGKKLRDMNTEEIRYGRVLYPLCTYEDIITFQIALEEYSKFLVVLIPKLMEISKLRMGLDEHDLAFGYFCFEVHSG